MVIQAPCDEYVLSSDFDLRAIARFIDTVLVRHFDGRKIVLRAISSQAHHMATAELTQQIERLGTDRYDSDRPGDRYENLEGRHIDLFGRTCTIAKGKTISLPLLEGFHIYGPEYSGEPALRMDIWSVYDRDQLRAVPHSYAGVGQRKHDGFVFRDPERKSAALLGVVVL